MLRICAALLLLILLPARCLALCSGQSAEQRVLVEDTFTNFAGNWDQVSGAWIGGGKMELTLDTQSEALTVLNRRTTLPGGDFCARFILPEPEEDNGSSASIVFWARDADNDYSVDFWSNGNVSFGQSVGGKWNEMVSIDGPERSWKGPDNVIELRVLATSGQVKVWVNGELIRSIDVVDSPPGNLRFGVYVEMDKPPQTSKIFQFQYFNVLQAFDSFR